MTSSFLIDPFWAIGIAPDPRLVFAGDFIFRSGAAAMLTLPVVERTKALFAVAGLRVPQDFSIVGFDAIDAADHCEPTLTTVSQPRREIGHAAGELLVRLMAGGSAPRAPLVLEAHLLPLDRTGPAPALRPRDATVEASGRSIESRGSATGAGEGIRTLDPNLGKVVLYP
jgi:hypothetical protein